MGGYASEPVMVLELMFTDILILISLRELLLCMYIHTVQLLPPVCLHIRVKQQRWMETSRDEQQWQTETTRDEPRQTLTYRDKQLRSEENKDEMRRTDASREEQRLHKRVSLASSRPHLTQQITSTWMGEIYLIVRKMSSYFILSSWTNSAACFDPSFEGWWKYLVQK